MTPDGQQPDQPVADEPSPQQDPPPPPPPRLELRDGLPDLVDTEDAFAEACAALGAGTGPVGIDAERASGYRYSSRAYLIQLRREGAGTWLVDPTALESMAPLQEALDGVEWILHAATQDLPCLAEVGLRPSSLFDTELAGRLLGYPRVGLATLVEVLLGRSLAKEHSAADWSTRPLPQSWLEYAALDVEVLVELRAILAAELEETGKAEWARQEFEALLSFEPTARVDAWRRTSGLHKVRGRRAIGAVRALWEERDEIARSRDVSPGRIIPDSALVAAALAMPTSRRALLSTRGFHGRGAERYANRWMAVLDRVRELPEDQLPSRAPRTDAPPQARMWAERDPEAAARLSHAREAISRLSEELSVPPENLLTPDTLRRVLWTPPPGRDAPSLTPRVAERMRELGARQWQTEVVGPVLVQAIVDAAEELRA